MHSKQIPIIDLFAGPGGLGEGFSSILDERNERVFDVRISIEKDPVAHRTLSLRSLFRSFPNGRVPDCYYDYIRGDITRNELITHPSVAAHVQSAFHEAKNATLGETSERVIDKWIREAIGNQDPWVLIGGPPCQAYSLAGRSRMRGVDPEAFEEDKRHFLYKEYLRIIRKFGPAVFVMENVKGILSSMHGGGLIFDRILKDLSKPRNGLSYDIRSFVVGGEGETLKPNDFIIEAEKFGIPQMRHRVILFGIRNDLRKHSHQLIQPARSGLVSVRQAISDLPPLRSRLSKEPDSHDSWLQIFTEASRKLGGVPAPASDAIQERMSAASKKACRNRSVGGRFMPYELKFNSALPAILGSWYYDPRLGGVTLHESRSHMRSDLHRYLFASCYAAQLKASPKLNQFPRKLLPKHGNVNDGRDSFSDRFRVQLWHGPSTTVVSHIAKDGHYYIHPDPSQCRSLTVREAARLQTFPDNYFFEGNRTEQYHQVGNAVPPMLAHQIAEVAYRFLAGREVDRRLTAKIKSVVSPQTACLTLAI